MPDRVVRRHVHRRVLAPPPRQAFANAAAWARSSRAVAVSSCESGGNVRAVSSTGRYRGKWQVSQDFWEAYGGLAFAATADRATEAEQDLVAFRGWLARGWRPWSCAR